MNAKRSPLGLPIPLTAAGGNSRLARSARVKLQWRDRFGRWIEMGRGVKFKVRFPDGTVKSVIGKMGGVKQDPNDPNETLGQVYVAKDPNGLPDGFYDVESANGQEILASLDAEALKKAGIDPGKDVNGNTVGERNDADIPDSTDASIYHAAPEGWTDNGDGSYTDPDGTISSKDGWDKAIAQLDAGTGSEDAPEQPETPDAPEEAPVDAPTESREVLQARLDRANKRLEKAERPEELDRLDATIKETEAKLKALDDGEKTPDAVADLGGEGETREKAQTAISDYDESGEIANDIEAGSSSADVFEKLSSVPAWKTDAEAYNEAREVPEASRTPEQQAAYDKMSGKAEAIAQIDAAPETPEAPEQPADAAPEPQNAPDAAQPVETPAQPVEAVPAAPEQAAPVAPQQAEVDSRSMPEVGGLVNEEFIRNAPVGTVVDAGSRGKFTKTKLAEGDTPGQWSSNKKGRLGDTDNDVAYLTKKTWVRLESQGDTATPEDAPAAPEAPQAPENVPDVAPSAPETAPEEPVEAPNGPELDANGDVEDLTGLVVNDYGVENAEVTKNPDGSVTFEAPRYDQNDDFEGLEDPQVFNSEAEFRDFMEENYGPLYPKAEEAPVGGEAPVEGPGYADMSDDELAAAWEDLQLEAENLGDKRPEHAAVVKWNEAKDEMEMRGLPTDLAPNKKYDPRDTMPPEWRQIPPPNGNPYGIGFQSPDSAWDVQYNGEGEWQLYPDDTDGEPINTQADNWDEVLQDIDAYGARRIERQIQAQQDEANRQQAEEQPDEPVAKPTALAPDGFTPENDKDLADMSDDALAQEIADLREKLGVAPAVQNQAPNELESEPVESFPDAPGGLPYSERSTDDLEDTIGTLETRLNALKAQNRNPAFQESLQRKIDEMYDALDQKYDEMNREDLANIRNTPAAPVEQAPEPAVDEGRPLLDNPEQIFDNDFEQIHDAAPSQVALLSNLLKAKDFQESDPEARGLEDKLIDGDLTNEEAARYIDALRNAPDRENIQTTPRPVPPANYVPDAASIDIKPGQMTDPNHIMWDLKRNHPGSYSLPNGDVVVLARDFNGKRYEAVVRRTGENRFFSYVRETDLNTGATRVAKIAKEVHSYKGLLGKMTAAKRAVSSANPAGWMAKNPNRENLDGRNLPGDFTSNPLDNDELDADIIGQAVDMIRDGSFSDEDVVRIINQESEKRGLSQGQADQLVDALQIRKVQEALNVAGVNNAGKENHLSYDGTPLKENDWVDWTDTDISVPVRDALGNTVYRKDRSGEYVLDAAGKKIAVNQKNPDYGRVFRGRVVKRKFKAGSDNGYVYSDGLDVVFPDRNRLRLDEKYYGKVNSRTAEFTSAGLRKVSGPDAELGAAFWPKETERNNQQAVGGAVVPADFGVPATGDGRVRRPRRKVQNGPVESVWTDSAGNTFIGDAANPIPVFYDQKQIALNAKREHVRDTSIRNLQPGDIWPTLQPDGKTVLNQVVSRIVNTDGSVTVELAQPLGGGRFQRRTVDFGNGWHPKVPIFRNPELVATPTQPGSEEGGPEWRDMQALYRQKQLMEQLLAERQVPSNLASDVEAALMNPDLRAGEAIDLLEMLLNLRDKRENRGGNMDQFLDNMLNAGGAPAEAVRPQVAAREARKLVPSNTPNPYPVREITWDDFETGRVGRNPQFKKARTFVETADLQPGDIVSMEHLGGLYAYQILSDMRSDGKYKVRILADPRTIKGGQAGQITTLAVSDRSLPVVPGVYRPTSNNSDYFENGFVPQYREDIGAKKRPMNQYLTPEQRELSEAYQGAVVVQANANQGQGQMSSRADIVELPDGRQAFVKEVKARTEGQDRRGRTVPMQDFPEQQQIDSEVLASELGRAIGVEMANVVDVGDGKTIIMDNIDGTVAALHPLGYNSANLDQFENSRMIGLLDYLLMNPDRNGGNIIIDSNTGEPIPIDQAWPSMGIPGSIPNRGLEYEGPYVAYALGKALPGRGFNLRMQPPKFSLAEIIDMQQRFRVLEPKFLNLGRADWFQNVDDRFQTLIDGGQLL